ncbi:uncharacterized protein LOC131890908 [Tigriopus californicus]|uniref:uncharacterized protein LOC131890908 n=1 Tax=Tigriopus californicus TaxID=6832 RepID=UPI0027DAA310|nr:uncharacterized protein LOC131890908 [Tigriopus californicus]
MSRHLLDFLMEGTLQLLEDCDTLDPIAPPTLISYFGTVFLICCPNPPNRNILFPLSDVIEEKAQSDYNPEEQVEGAFDYYDSEYVDYEYASQDPDSIDSTCHPLECMDRSLCDLKDFEGLAPPSSCGWANDEMQYCCTPRLNSSESPLIRLSGTDSKLSAISSRDCLDQHEFCSYWANNDTCGPESQHFQLMIMACMKSCGICKNKGCHDDFLKCADWARLGFCALRPDSMLFNCRASCGLCGEFHGGRDHVNQRVHGKTYSHPQDPNFYCGGGRRKGTQNETNNSESESGNSAVSILGNPLDENSPLFANRILFRESRNKRSANDSHTGFFAYTNENEGLGFFCGSVMISDEFFVSAAHCYAKEVFDPQIIKTVTLRQGTPYEETVEVKRIFIHPNFQLPSLHDDIAIGQLGRRIEYDYTKYGDSPNCLPTDDNDKLEGSLSFVQGRGRTEKGLLSSTLLEANMTIIENGLCFQDLCHRSQRDRILTSLMAAHLPFGIPSDMMCATGFLDVDSEKYTSPCHGDSGGPLYTRQEAIGENRGQTLVGLVSGGLSCGERTPSWFTRVSKYTRWVLCILTATKRFNHRAQILEDCQSLAPRIRRDPRQCSSTIQ